VPRFFCFFFGVTIALFRTVLFLSYIFFLSCFTFFFMCRLHTSVTFQSAQAQSLSRFLLFASLTFLPVLCRVRRAVSSYCRSKASFPVRCLFFFSFIPGMTFFFFVFLYRSEADGLFVMQNFFPFPLECEPLILDRSGTSSFLILCCRVAQLSGVNPPPCWVVKAPAGSFFKALGRRRKFFPFPAFGRKLLFPFPYSRFRGPCRAFEGLFFSSVSFCSARTATGCCSFFFFIFPPWTFFVFKCVSGTAVFFDRCNPVFEFCPLLLFPWCVVSVACDRSGSSHPMRNVF